MERPHACRAGRTKPPSLRLPAARVFSHPPPGYLFGIDLVAIRQKHVAPSDLVAEETTQLLHTQAEVASTTVHELKRGSLAEVVERLNEIVDDEDFTKSQHETWLQGLVRTLLDDEQVRT